MIQMKMVSPVNSFERDFQLKQELENLDLAEKEALMNLHWTLDDYENADFYKLQRVLNAKEEKDREIDPLSLL